MNIVFAKNETVRAAAKATCVLHAAQYLPTTITDALSKSVAANMNVLHWQHIDTLHVYGIQARNALVGLWFGPPPHGAQPPATPVTPREDISHTHVWINSWLLNTPTVHLVHVCVDQWTEEWHAWLESWSVAKPELRWSFVVENINAAAVARLAEIRVESLQLFTDETYPDVRRIHLRPRDQLPDATTISTLATEQLFPTDANYLMRVQGVVETCQHMGSAGNVIGFRGPYVKLCPTDAPPFLVKASEDAEMQRVYMTDELSVYGINARGTVHYWARGAHLSTALVRQLASDMRVYYADAQELWLYSNTYVRHIRHRVSQTDITDTTFVKCQCSAAALNGQHITKPLVVYSDRIHTVILFIHGQACGFAKL